MLNCKPGQWAVKIKGEADHVIPVGAIVRVEQLIQGPDGYNFVGQYVSGDQWIVEYQGSNRCPVDDMYWAVADRNLKPLLGDIDGEEDLYSIDKPITEESC